MPTGHTDSVYACAFSPDGALLATASDDRTARLWDGQSGASLGAIPRDAGAQSLAFHPGSPRPATGTAGGEVVLVDLEGVRYDPLIATAIQAAAGPTVRCPVCQQELPIMPDHVGQTLVYPTPWCDLCLHLNPFVTTLDRCPHPLLEWAALPWWRKLFTRRPTPPGEA